jgi:hypothetical protein
MRENHLSMSMATVSSITLKVYDDKNSNGTVDRRDLAVRDNSEALLTPMSLILTVTTGGIPVNLSLMNRIR